MSHFIYSTEAIILSEMPSGEDGKLYFLLTNDLGFIMAQATGVRLLKSKLRFHLSLFARIQVELVRGKNIWRVVNVYPTEAEVFYGSSHTPLFARLAELVRRMVHGEEDNKKLFEEMKTARNILLENKLSREESDNFELVAVARVLHSLGYFNIGNYGAIFNQPLSKEIIPLVTPLRHELVLDINQSLKESHL